MSILRVRFVSTGWTGGPGLSTFYYAPGGSPAVQADATEASARVRAFFSALGASGAMPSGWGGSVDPVVSVLDEENGDLVNELDAADSTAVSNVGAGALGATTTMALLRMTTAGFAAGRRVRGRSYIGPGAATWWSGGLLTTGTQNAIQTSADGALDTTIATATVTHVIWSRPTPTRLGSTHVVTGYGVSREPAVLRSRRD